MTDLMVTARVGRYDVAVAGNAAGFSGTDSRGSVVRYALMRAIGYSDAEARARTYKKPGRGMAVTGDKVAAQIDAQLLAEIDEKRPAEIRDRATFIRYALALASDYPPDEALAIAHRDRGRPRKEAA